MALVGLEGGFAIMALFSLEGRICHHGFVQFRGGDLPSWLWRVQRGGFAIMALEGLEGGICHHGFGGFRGGDLPSWLWWV